jgi:hypothetical protein
VRGMFAGKSGEPKGLVETATKWYLGRHLDTVFEGAADASPRDPDPILPPEPAAGSVGTAALLLGRCERPVLVLGSGPSCRPRTRPAREGRRGPRDPDVALGHGARPPRRRFARPASPQAEGGAARGRPRPPRGRPLRLPARLRAADRPLGDARLRNRDAKALTLNRRPTLGVSGDPALFLESSPRSAGGLRARSLALSPSRSRRGARRGDRGAPPRAGRGRSTRSRSAAGSRRPSRRAASSSRTAATSSPPLPTSCARGVRSPGSTRASSGRSASARASRSARPSAARTRTSSSSGATARPATASSRSTRSCATASGSSPSSGTTRAGRRSRGSRSRS